ncbi:MAG: nucleotide exchange factor GrpE [Nocardiopsis sp. BM-2018]|nr:MAG: nucleotide exchange factor GrpE [Nocardiopsis sp. BM-2018]
MTAMPDDERRTPHDEAHGGADTASAADLAEVEILRAELGAASERLAALEAEHQACLDKVLRARADLENTRRRHAAELERAREAGLDAAILPVLSVYDDLGRALQAAAGGDPGSIVPGVRSVRESLERALEGLGVTRVGDVGDTFDPARHEALAVVPAGDGRPPGAIAEVFEAGFVRGDRLVRPARVVVAEQG